MTFQLAHLDMYIYLCIHICVYIYIDLCMYTCVYMKKILLCIQIQLWKFEIKRSKISHVMTCQQLMGVERNVYRV